MCVHVRAIAQVLGTEDNLLESVFFFHHVGPGDETQVGRLGRKCLHPLSPLAALPSHQNVFLKVGSLFVGLEVEAYISWQSAPGVSPTVASFILLAQHLALQPLPGLHSTSSPRNNTLAFCWSNERLDLGGFDPRLLTFSASDNVLADTISLFTKTEKLSGSAVLLGPNC